MAAITLDGLDVRATYGVIAIRGSYNDLVRMPDLKEVSTYSWPTEDGDDHILTARKTANRDITLTFLLTGSSAADMFTKRDALFAALKADGLRSLFINSLNKTFSMYYKSCDSASLVQGEKHRIKMSLKFRLIVA